MWYVLVPICPYFLGVLHPWFCVQSSFACDSTRPAASWEDIPETDVFLIHAKFAKIKDFHT